MAHGISRRETRSQRIPHSVDCLSQSRDQSPRKRRKADPNSISSSGKRCPTGRRRPKLLQSVIDSCQPCILESLGSGGASINLQDDDGYTALMVAIEVGTLDTVRLLISEGADAAMRNAWGETALHLAVNRSGTSASAIVGRLLACGRSAVNIQSSSGCTPLFLAVGGNNPDVLAIVRDLIEAGADLEVRGSDPDVLNGREMTPFELAATVGNFELCGMLYEEGCRMDAVQEWIRRDSFPRMLRLSSQWMEVMMGWAKQPRMLQEVCRIRIRREMRRCGMDVRRVRESALPLPLSLGRMVLHEP